MDEVKKIEFTSAFKTLYTSFIINNTVPGIMNRDIFYSEEDLVDGLINKQFTRNREDVYAVYCSLYNSVKKTYIDIVFYCNTRTLFDRFRIFSKTGNEYEYLPNVTLLSDQLTQLNNRNNLIKVCYFDNQFDNGSNIDSSNTYSLEQMQKCLIHNIKIYPKYIWLDIFETS